MVANHNDILLDIHTAGVSMAAPYVLCAGLKQLHVLYETVKRKICVVNPLGIINTLTKSIQPNFPRVPLIY